MALRVWLPLNGNLNNQGLDNTWIETYGTLSFIDNGKIGKAYASGEQGDFKVLWTYPQTNKLTLCFWVKPSSSAGSWTDMFSFGSGHHRLERSSSGTYQYYVDSGNTALIQNGATIFNSLPTDQWSHITMTIDEDLVVFYVNGAQRAGAVATSTLSNVFGENNKGFFYFGCRYEATSYYKGNFNDIRIYDEVLSQKQIKEISKGLVAHYKLDNPYIENTTNLVTGIDNKTTISVNNSPAWDTIYNGTPMYTPVNWSSGYNSGVTDATHGYHARWIQENGKWIMMFPNLNSVISQKGRWLGISGNADTANILAGEKYTISWWQKTDNLSLAAYGGIYYKKTSDGTQNFWDGNNTLGYNTKLNTWERMTRVFTRNSEYVQHSTAQYIYVYGYNSTYEGTVYVKDVQVERGDHATPFSIGTRNLTYETDDSGNGFDAPKYGTLVSNTNTPRYDICTNFSSGYLHKIPSPLNSSSDAFTISCWFYPTQNATMCLINDRIAVGDGLALFYYGGGIRFDTGSSYQWQVGSITLNAWNHVVVTWDKNAGNKKLYLNGALINTTTSYGTLANIGSVFSIGNSSTNGAAGAGNQIYGSLSDFRIYATALTADDILTLYKTSGIIDNKGNVYTYEFKEE